MGKTRSNAHEACEARTTENAAADAANATEQPQLTFFDTVTPPTMTTENSSPAEHVQSDAGNTDGPAQPIGACPTGAGADRASPEPELLADPEFTPGEPV